MKLLVSVLLCSLVLVQAAVDWSAECPPVPACLVDPPGRPATPLPAQLNLRPTSAQWAAHFHISDQQRKSRACLSLSPRQLQLSEGHCGVNNTRADVVRTNYTSRTDWWNIVSVELHQQQLQVNARGASPVHIPLLSQQLQLRPWNLSSVSLSYNCHDKCFFQQTRDTLKQQFHFNNNNNNNTIQVFFHPLPGFRDLTVQATFSRLNGGTLKKTVATISSNSVACEWQQLNIVFDQQHHLGVLLSGQQLHTELQDTWHGVQPLHVTVTMTGLVWWSPDCRPSPAAVTTTPHTLTTAASLHHNTCHVHQSPHTTVQELNIHENKTSDFLYFFALPGFFSVHIRIALLLKLGGEEMRGKTNLTEDDVDICEWNSLQLLVDSTDITIIYSGGPLQPIKLPVRLDSKAKVHSVKITFVGPARWSVNCVPSVSSASSSPASLSTAFVPSPSTITTPSSSPDTTPVITTSVTPALSEPLLVVNFVLTVLAVAGSVFILILTLRY